MIASRYHNYFTTEKRLNQYKITLLYKLKNIIRYYIYLITKYPSFLKISRSKKTEKNSTTSQKKRERESERESKPEAVVSHMFRKLGRLNRDVPQPSPGATQRSRYFQSALRCPELFRKAMERRVPRRRIAS